MTVVEKVEAEVKRLQAILDRKGILWEDQKAEYDSYKQVLGWFAEEKAEADRIELEALEAEEAAAANDPNKRTRDMFRGVKIKVPARV